MSEKSFKKLPQAKETYKNIIKSMLPMSDKPKGKKGQLPDVTYRVDNLKIDARNLNEYRKICGFARNGNVPIIYFAVLSQSLQMNMMVKEAFPFAMLGLVHIDNSVTQYRNVSDKAVVSMTVKLDNLRDHEKGKQFDFVTKVTEGDELVWEGTTTYLSRSGSGGGDKKKASKKPAEKMSIDTSSLHTYFKAPDDIGRRYAAISGDYNLIHIHPLSAKALGFPTAIAHGMWSMAKCLSYVKGLPESYRLDASFKLPILLPSEVELIIQEEVNNEIDLGLYNAKNAKPHLAAKITKLG